MTLHEKAMFTLAEKIAYDKGKKAGYARKERELERETEDMIENMYQQHQVEEKIQSPKDESNFYEE